MEWIVMAAGAAIFLFVVYVVSDRIDRGGGSGGGFTGGSGSSDWDTTTMIATLGGAV